MSARKILILGATSAIAEQAARCFAAEGAVLHLCARSQVHLEQLAADLRVRGASAVTTSVFDAGGYVNANQQLTDILIQMGHADVALIAWGTLPDQKACEQDLEKTLSEFVTNATAVIAWLTVLAGYFEQRGGGVIAAITSVAGMRGRQSNYVYGAAKGAVSLYLQGLRNRLYPAGVTVVDIRPGFVDTPMTQAFRKGLLWASAQRVGQGIYRAINRRRQVVYLPWFWRWIMLVITRIPESLFKRLKL